MELSVNEQAMKTLMKEKNQLFLETMAEALKDVAMAKAIEEAKDSPSVPKSKIMETLGQVE